MQKYKQLELFEDNTSINTLDLKVIQNVISLNKSAGYIQRMFALIIDIIFIEFIMSVFWGIFKPAFIFISTFYINHESIKSSEVIFIILAQSIILLWYFTTATYIFGSTFGKFITNIKVINKTKSPITIKACMIRHFPLFFFYVALMGANNKVFHSVFLLAAYFLLLDLFLPIFRKDKKAFHDLLSHTTVVKI